MIIMIGAAFKVVWEKVNGKADKDMCDVLHVSIKNEFARGKDRFDRVEKKLDIQSETLMNFDKNLALMAQSMQTMAKNGKGA